MRNRPTKSPPGRGVTLFELTVAAGMLTLFLATSVRMMAALGVVDRAADRRALAQCAVDNLVEGILAMPWDEVTSTRLSHLELPKLIAGRLPGGKLSVEVQDESEPVATRRVTVSLAWSDPRGRRTGPVRMTTWIFRPAGEAR